MEDGAPTAQQLQGMMSHLLPSHQNYEPPMKHARRETLGMSSAGSTAASQSETDEVTAQPCSLGPSSRHHVPSTEPLARVHDVHASGCETCHIPRTVADCAGVEPAEGAQAAYGTTENRPSCRTSDRVARTQSALVGCVSGRRKRPLVGRISEGRDCKLRRLLRGTEGGIQQRN